MRGLDHDHAGRIETETIETVSGKTTVSPLAVSRDDEDDRVSPWQARKKRRYEAEGGGVRAFARRHDFMQGAGGEAAFRQVGIERGKTEGQGVAQALADGKKPAQFMDCGSTRRR